MAAGRAQRQCPPWEPCLERPYPTALTLSGPGEDIPGQGAQWVEQAPEGRAAHLTCYTPSSCWVRMPVPTTTHPRDSRADTGPSPSPEPGLQSWRGSRVLQMRPENSGLVPGTGPLPLSSATSVASRGRATRPAGGQVERAAFLGTCPPPPPTCRVKLVIVERVCALGKPRSASSPPHSRGSLCCASLLRTPHGAGEGSRREGRASPRKPKEGLTTATLFRL